MLFGASNSSAQCSNLLLRPAHANPLTDPTMNASKTFLFELEARFAKDVAERGGAGFAAWFAEDGVTLGNGAAPPIGKLAISSSATWSPRITCSPGRPPTRA